MSSIVPVSLVVSFLSLIIPKLGLNIGSAELTTTVQVIVSLISGVVVLLQHKKVVGQAQLGGQPGK